MARSRNVGKLSTRRRHGKLASGRLIRSKQKEAEIIRKRRQERDNPKPKPKPKPRSTPPSKMRNKIRRRTIRTKV
jgi:hypothetical protein